MPKCLTEVNGIPILGQLVSSLARKGFKRLVIVTGHMEQCIREFLGSQSSGITIEYLFCPQYKTTNNIYSLWKAREIIQEPFLLVESDLVFDASLLDNMVYPDRIAVARMQPWMNGTTVTINKSKQVETFHKGEEFPSDEIRYKTVNIYSFSQASWSLIKDRLDQYICAGKVHDYYETVFTEMVTEGSLGFDSVSFDGKYWYEIDTLEDLEKAEKLFSAKKPVVVVSRKAKMCISEKIIKPLSDHKIKIIDTVKDKTLTNIKALPWQTI